MGVVLGVVVMCVPLHQLIASSGPANSIRGSILSVTAVHNLFSVYKQVLQYA